MIRHRKKIIFGIIIPLVLGIILVAIFLRVGNFAQASLIGETATPVDPILASLSEKIDRLDKLLRDDNLLDETRKKLLAEKNYLVPQVTQRADYLSHKDEAVKAKLTALAEMDLTQTAYIKPTQKKPTPYNGPLTEFYAPKYRETHFITAWIIQDDNISMFILAGSYSEDPDQGIVYIENRIDQTLGKYRTPDKDGSLRIKSVINNHLFLESKNGKNFIFNMDKRKFVDENDNPLPEATQTPAPAYPAAP